VKFWWRSHVPGCVGAYFDALERAGTRLYYFASLALSYRCHSATPGWHASRAIRNVVDTGISCGAGQSVSLAGCPHGLCRTYTLHDAEAAPQPPTLTTQPLASIRGLSDKRHASAAFNYMLVYSACQARNAPDVAPGVGMCGSLTHRNH
jgi:hypothetical protein